MINPDMSGYGSVDPVQQTVDIAKRAGARLRRSGFAKTRFMIGTEETEEISLQVATAILSDPDAREDVGAIGYHSYPYDEGYSSIPFILNTSGAGVPDRGRVAVRTQIRDLGKRYNVQVWMTENSHAGDPRSYDDFRARAIQIHDEFIYADASAYFGENAMWDLASQRLHSGSDDLYGADNEGNIVLINNDTGAVDITGIGYAIGHYARWIKPGSVRIDATSSDPLVQITAFRDDKQQRVALVLINNSPIAKNVTFNLRGLALTGNVTGEQSTRSGYWQPISALAPTGPGAFSITLPNMSVTSVGVSLTGSLTPQIQCVSAASLIGPVVAADSIATAFVPNLPISPRATSSPPFPASIAVVSLTLLDRAVASQPVPLCALSPNKINFLVPAAAAAGPASVTVTGGAVLASGQVTIAAVAPGLFSANGDGQGVAEAQSRP